jgi:antitoxin component YwqK of YwqJK toxin-antitoxin module
MLKLYPNTYYPLGDTIIVFRPYYSAPKTDYTIIYNNYKDFGIVVDYYDLIKIIKATLYEKRILKKRHNG